MSKRLELLHQIVPKAISVAVLLNPANGTSSDTQLRDVQAAAYTIGLQIHVLKANTSREIDAAFAALERERPDALFVANSGFFTSRGVQIVNLAARERIPAAYSSREIVAVGGLMSYGTDIEDTLRQIGVYAGRILKGAKPADLPVVQATKFEFIINMQSARLLGLNVPPEVLAIADKVIE